MSNFVPVCKREFKAYFQTPIALIFLTVFLVLTGFFTFKLGGLYENNQADLKSFFVWHPWLYLLIVPAVSMRLWAEEKRTGTVELLFTLPVTLFEAMAGKFVAAWAFIGFALVLTFPVVGTVYYLGEPDFGPIVASYLGSFLMAGAFLAMGLFVSATTANQIISFIISTAVILVFILLGFPPVVDLLLKVFPSEVVGLLSNLGVPYQYELIQRGVVDLRALIYFISITIFFLVAGAIVLDKSRAE